MSESGNTDRDGTTEPKHEATVKRPKFERRGASYGFELVVLEGPDVGARVMVDRTGGSCLIGQSSVCGFRLTDPRISAQHCAIQMIDQRLRVADLASNQTSINGVLTREAFL